MCNNNEIYKWSYVTYEKIIFYILGYLKYPKWDEHRDVNLNKYHNNFVILKSFI